MENFTPVAQRILPLIQHRGQSLRPDTLSTAHLLHSSDTDFASYTQSTATLKLISLPFVHSFDLTDIQHYGTVLNNL